MVNIKAWSVAKRKAEGFADISSFMKRRRGRPKRRATIQEVVQASKKTRKQAAAPKRKPTPATSLPTNKTRESKKTRTNWSKGEDAKRMAMSVEDWLGKKGNALDDNGEVIPLRQFSNIVNIPYKTLTKYVQNDSSKRRELGKSVGTKPILDDSDRKFMTDILRRADRGNEGMDRREAIDTLQDLFPDRALTRASCSRVLTRSILNHPDNKGLLKKKPVVAQSTTTKRSAITFVQQWRWHKTVDSALNLLRLRNTGV